MMHLINRCAIVLTAKQPFADWINHLPDEPDNITPEELRSETSIYLIPEYNFDKEAERYLKKVYKDLFEQELFSWWTDPADWPPRDFKTFRRFFDVDFKDMIFDIGRGEIIKKE